MSQHEVSTVWETSLLLPSACQRWSIWGWNNMFWKLLLIRHFGIYHTRNNVSSTSHIFFYQLTQGCQQDLVSIFVTADLNKNKFRNKLSFPATASSLSFTRATILKIGVMIVCVCLCACVCVCVCTGAKKIQLCVQYVLVLRGECKWFSTWEQSATTVRFIVYNHSL